MLKNDFRTFYSGIGSKMIGGLTDHLYYTTINL